MTSSSAKGITNMVALARSEPRLIADPTKLDADPWVINVRNGTLDLRTCELRPHRQSDMITKLAAVSYDPAARAPRWEQFLEQIQPDPELRGWIQRFVGYCLTGDVNEQVMLFALGMGSNGKNVLFDALLAMLGEYAMTAAPDLLMVKHNDEHPTAFADLQGSRLVVVSEIDHGRQWAEATIKRLTGDKSAKARRMREDFIEFLITFKLAVMANTKPEVRGTDNGIWRRILLAPFDVTIPEEARDKHLPSKLLEELDGIFAWAVRGCLEWQKHGLAAPAAVRSAVAEYRREQDVVGNWLSERCVCVCSAADRRWHDDGVCETCGAAVQEGLEVDHPREPLRELYDDFAAWLESGGMMKWKLATFRAELIKRRGLGAFRTKAMRGITGIKLRHTRAVNV